MFLDRLSTKRKTLSLFSISVAMLAPAICLADDVTLRSSDGTVNLVGELIEFTDNSYVLRTVLGDVRVSGSQVRCEGADCPDFGVIEADSRISGSSAVGDGLMPLLLSGFAGALRAEVTQTATGTSGQFVADLIGEEGFGDPLGSYLVTSTRSTDAFSTLLDQTSEIGMSSRRIQPDEAQALSDSGAGNMISPDQEHIIAVDTLVVITHPENPIKSITMNQLRAVYNGAIANWSELGGNDAPITVYSRDEDTGTRGVFDNGVFGQDAPDLPSTAQIAPSENQMAASVNADVNAIGFVGFAFQRGASPLTLISDCGISMVPDAFSARTEEYALQRFLYLYTRGDLNEQSATEFVNYTTSNEADTVVAKAGFIDLGIDRREQTADGDRAQQLLSTSVDAIESGFIREMLTEMVNYDRLSTTFRFRTGSSALDPRGRSNLERLANYLETQPEGTEVQFVGFTDDIGAFESNRALSVGRADQVMAEMRNFAGDRLNGIVMASRGFGEIAPSACNTSDNERQINRRVEVWIKSGNG